MIKVLIVDDHAIVRQGLKRILAETPDMTVAGEAENGVEALKKTREGEWDVILLDVSMPGRNGVDTLKQIMGENRGGKVLILSMYPEDQYAVRLLKAGAAGYMTKETPPGNLWKRYARLLREGNTPARRLPNCCCSSSISTLKSSRTRD